MRENRTSGSMRGCRKRATSRRACALLYAKRAFAPDERMYLRPRFGQLTGDTRPFGLVPRLRQSMAGFEPGF